MAKYDYVKDLSNEELLKEYENSIANSYNQKATTAEKEILKRMSAYQKEKE